MSLQEISTDNSDSIRNAFSTSDRESPKHTEKFPWARFSYPQTDYGNKDSQFHPWGRFPTELRVLTLEAATDGKYDKTDGTTKLTLWAAFRQVNRETRQFALTRLPSHIILQTPSDHSIAKHIFKSLEATNITIPRSISITFTILDGLHGALAFFRSNMATVRDVQGSGHLQDLRLEVDPKLCGGSPLFRYPSENNYMDWNSHAGILAGIKATQFHFIGGDTPVDVLALLRERSTSEETINHVASSPFPFTYSTTWANTCPNGVEVLLPTAEDGSLIEPGPGEQLRLWLAPRAEEESEDGFEQDDGD